MVSGLLFQLPWLLGKDLKSGLAFGRPLRGLQAGYKLGVKGTGPFVLAGAALSAATAPRGHALSAASRPLGSIPGMLVGGLFGGTVGAALGADLGDKLFGRPAERALQALHDLGSKTRGLEMGGNFQDSEQAWTMRQVAVREMGRSLLNARRFLGSEAALMHT